MELKKKSRMEKQRMLQTDRHIRGFGRGWVRLGMFSGIGVSALRFPFADIFSDYEKAENGSKTSSDVILCQRVTFLPQMNSCGT